MSSRNQSDDQHGKPAACQPGNRQATHDETEAIDKSRETTLEVDGELVVAKQEGAEAARNPKDGKADLARNADLPESIACYEILAEVGRGGMGIVYQALDPRLKRHVALKVILAGEHAGGKELQRFQTEAEAVARLRHPNIVQVYEVGEEKGHPFIALEYCSGGSLSDRIEARLHTPNQSAELVAYLADAMEHSHRAGVIHRDLKPANILFDENGIPKIADFGLAKKIDEDEGHTRTGMIMGSVGYMSPEQASGQTADIKTGTDIYSLGAILYRLVSGQPPFQGSSVMETLNLVIFGEVVPLRRLKPSCPRDLETICLKCLNKTTANRYATAGELEADLRRFIKGEPIQARASTPYEQMVSWARRNPLPTSIAGISILMLAILSITLAWMTYQNYEMVQQIEGRDMRVQELRGRILFLDEVLTNSCALASLTGEPRWQERYQKYESELVESINEAVALVPDAKRELDKVSEANEALIQIENRVFTQVAEGNRSEAWNLLNGEGYRDQKDAYVRGMQGFSTILREYSQATVEDARQEAMTFLVTALVLGLIVLGMFLIGAYSFIRTLGRSSRGIESG